MKYKEVRTGDKVESCLAGWGEMTKLFRNSFRVKYKSRTYDYRFDGKRSNHDVNPEIINWEPKLPEGMTYHRYKGKNIWILDIDNWQIDYSTRKEAEETFAAYRKKNEKWQPVKGDWAVTDTGVIDLSTGYEFGYWEICQKAGSTYKTKELAERAAKMLRNYARVLNYVLHDNPEWKPDWSDEEQPKYKIKLNHRDDNILMLSNTLIQSLCGIHMSQATAKKLKADLESGRFELEE